MSNHKGGNATKPPKGITQPVWILRRLKKIQRPLQRGRAKDDKHDSVEHAANSTAWATWAIAFLTFVTIGVGISQYITFNRQLTVMQSQLDEMRSSGKQTDEAIKATNRLADAAASANNLAISANRPWIGILPPILSQMPTLGVTSKIIVPATNAGRSTAKVISFAASAAVYLEFPDDPEYFVTTGGKIPSQSVVVPGQGTTAPFDSVLQPVDAARLNAEVGRYYIYAKLVYSDLIGGGTHTTRACYYIITINSFGVCTKYNDAN